MSADIDFYNIEKRKQTGNWPVPEQSAYGMIPYLKRTLSDLVGIEVGVLKGENVYTLLESLPSIKKIWGVDNYLPHTDFDTVRTEEQMKEFERIAKENLSSFGDRYELLKQKSVDAVSTFQPESIDFILLDCEHTYEGVRRDLDVYYPLLKKGGYMFVHDTFSIPIVDAILNWKSDNRVRSPVHKSKNYVDFWQK
jgi:hypothetical protein